MKEPLDPLGEAVRDRLDILEGKRPAAEAQIGGEQDITNEQRQRVPYIVAMYRLPCFLCGLEPPCDFFLPFKYLDDIVTQWRITALCRECKEMPDVYERIRDKLWQELSND